MFLSLSVATQKPISRIYHALFTASTQPHTSQRDPHLAYGDEENASLEITKFHKCGWVGEYANFSKFSLSPQAGLSVLLSLCVHECTQPISTWENVPIHKPHSDEKCMSISFSDMILHHERRTGQRKRSVHHNSRNR